MYKKHFLHDNFRFQKIGSTYAKENKKIFKQIFAKKIF